MEVEEYSWGKNRYGFQGQETDGEWLDGAVMFKYRIHDARLGRFLSVDPLYADYAYNSPYAFSENQVISHVELEGLEKKKATKTVQKRKKPKLKNDRFDGTNWFQRLLGIQGKGKYHKNLVLNGKKVKKPKSVKKKVEEMTGGDGSLEEEKEEEKEEIEEEEKEEEEAGIQIEMEQKFEANSDEFFFKNAAKEELNEAAKELRKAKGDIVVEVGTTGRKGEWWARRLTWKRGRKMKRELSDRGIDPKRIKVKRVYDTEYKVVIKAD